jgi:hypothetical protein
MSDVQGRYEYSDARTRPLVLFGFVLALLLIGSLAVSAWLDQRFTARIQAADVASPVRDLRRGPEGPALQAVPARELAAQRAREQRLLTATEWVDPVNRIVRIPVDRALELCLAEGFPARAAGGAGGKK